MLAHQGINPVKLRISMVGVVDADEDDEVEKCTLCPRELGERPSSS